MTIQDAIDRLRERSRMPLFVVQVWDPVLDQALRTAEPEVLFEGRTLREPRMAAAALAGLHLWNDSFSACHNLAQGLHDATGSYWHGVAHRREGHQGDGLEANLRNAKYWFRQTGEHPAFDAVYRSALNVLDSAGTGFRWASEAADTLRQRRRWDPFLLVDWFGEAEANTISTQAQTLLEEIQWREIDLLVDWCLQQAVGD